MFAAEMRSPREVAAKGESRENPSTIKASSGRAPIRGEEKSESNEKKSKKVPGASGK